MTLVELVVVAVLVAVLTAILYRTLDGIMRAKEMTSQLRSSDQTAHYLFSRITAELAGRSFIPLNTREDDKQQSGQPSFGGTPKYLVGTSDESGDARHDTLRFVSANAAQPFVGGPANHGMVEVEYHLADNPEREKLPFSGDGPTPMVLVRTEEPAAVNTGEILDKRKIILPVAENVVSLGFRYLKDGAWQKEWKETNPPLPEAIEIAIGIREKSGEVEVYKTSVPISAKRRRQ